MRAGRSGRIPRRPIVFLQVFGMARRSNLSAQVRHRIFKVSLASGPTLDSVAAELKLSPRTLQRRLQREGCSFSGILDDLRKCTAIRAVTEGPCDLKELATSLGYRQQSTFTRAMLRWTGKTPSAFSTAPRQRKPDLPTGSGQHTHPAPPLN